MTDKLINKSVKMPSRQQIVEAMQTAYWNMPKDDHLIPDDSQLRVNAALDAVLILLPNVLHEDAADCYHLLRLLRIQWD